MRFGSNLLQIQICVSSSRFNRDKPQSSSSIDDGRDDIADNFGGADHVAQKLALAIGSGGNDLRHGRP